MQNSSLEMYKKVHFIGIGGVSMSGLAEILKDKGYTVQGSDSKASETTRRLAAQGIDVRIGHEATNIGDDIDLVVYTAAIQDNNPERAEAERKNILVMDRAALVGALMKHYTYPISIAGTHGKTTTTSMITEVFLAAEKNPTVSVGGVLPTIGGNIRIGGDDYFIVETCEYCDSFLKFNPYGAIVLNIDADHMDYFKDLAHIMASFRQFAQRIPADGMLVIHSDIEDVSVVITDLPCRVITYGLDKTKSDWYPENIRFDQSGYGAFDAYCRGQFVCTIQLQVPGIHNVLNALGVCALATGLGVQAQQIVEGLMNFRGTNRRFQIKGSFRGVTVVDDYAHHPTEIAATIKAARNYPFHELWCVFQPHTYSRTKAFLTEFAQTLAEADHIILVDIYAARETDDLGISTQDLVTEIKKLGKDVLYFKTFEEAKQYLVSTCINNDMLITMGAGDVYLLGESMLE